ncbi:hypothetical protein B0H11DRAFT_2224793 [Mycena galericulata]|nr:hypothetical protein B0H11DRAFT_2224793 [Mycena galericulata]
MTDEDADSESDILCVGDAVVVILNKGKNIPVSEGAKDVAAHVAEWSEIYNMIGLEDTQEKIVALFNSLAYSIQTEIYRKGLDPEVATWGNIVKAAGEAEVLVKIDQKNRSTETEYQSQEDEDQDESDFDYDEDNIDVPEDADEPADNQDDRKASTPRNGGRVEAPRARATMHSAAVEVHPEDDQPRSQGWHDDYMRKGLCFNCGGRGHIARDCPSRKFNRSNETRFDTHAVRIAAETSTCDALYASTEVLKTLHVGSVHFDALLEVVEGGVEPMEFFDDFSADFDALTRSSDFETQMP